MLIVITNVYCYKNKGDAGLVIAMVETLKKKYKNPTIKIVSLYPEMDLGKYDEDVEVLEPPIKILNKGNKYITAVHNLFGYFCMRIRWFFGRFSKTEKAIKDADLVLSCGGGYMQSFNVKYFINNFILHYVQLQCAVKFNKKFVIFAQTIGPFDSFTKKMVSPILEKAYLVTAREKISFSYAMNNFNIKNLQLTADAAFLLEPEVFDFDIDKSMTNIGLTVRDWSFPNSGQKEQLKENYIHVIVDFIEYYSKNGTCCMYIMPQCIGPNADNDLIISKKIFNCLKNRKNVYLIEDDLTPKQLRYAYSKMDYFVGTRMHSNIFALGSGTPCLAISYDYKTNGIMELAGMSDYVIDIKDITLEQLKERFERLCSDNTVKERIIEAVNKIKEDSMLNFTLLEGSV